MKTITNFIKNKFQRVRKGPLHAPGKSKPVNMTHALLNPRNILILPYNRMGTLLLATRVFKTLRDHYKGASISVAVHDSWSVLIQGDPAIDKVVAFGDYIESPFSKDFKNLGKFLADQKYDLAFFLSYQYDREIAYLTRLSEAVLRVSFGRGEEEGLFNVEIVPSPGIRYEVDRYIEMFRTLGIEGTPRDYTMTVNDSIRQKARMRYLPAGPVSQLGRVVGYDLTREIVGEPVSRKTAEHIIKTLVTGLKATVIVFFEPGKTALAAELKEIFGKDIILVEDRPVSLLAGAISFCRLIIAHNSALFQLSVALKCPTLAIFSKTALTQWSPGESHETVHLDCDEGSWPSQGVIIQSIKKLLAQTKKTGSS